MAAKFYEGKLLPGDGVSGQYHEIRHGLQDQKAIARALQDALQAVAPESPKLVQILTPSTPDNGV